MSDPVSDPFRSLSVIATATEPDPGFVDAVMRDVQARLRSPSTHTTSHARMEPSDLDVESTDAPPGSRSGARHWWLVAAASVAVVGGGLLAITVIRDDPEPLPASEPTPVTAPATTTTSTVPPTNVNPILPDTGFPALDPGTYVIDPDDDPSTPLTVTYEVPDGWSTWFGAVYFYDGDEALEGGLAGHVLLSITTVDNVVTDGCIDHRPADPPVGPTVDDLATALAGLAPFELTAPPMPVSAFGYEGIYLQLTIPETPTTGESFTDCSDGNIHSWIAPLAEGSFYGYNAEPGRVEEFWILDVEGSRLVIETNYAPDSPEMAIAEMRSIVGSIRIEP